MRINTNLTAMNTFTQYTKNNNKIADSVEKLSSGYAINSAADNAAGLAISEKMRAQIRGLEQASVNSQDAISLIQTAEGGLNESTEILQRMRELAVQSANDTNENEIDREALQDEFAQLQEELNNIANTTTFNKKNLLDGSLAKKQATTQNLQLANAGLSVSLGNVAAGQYTFETVVKVESAAVEAQTATMTATSTDNKVSVKVQAAASDALQKTSLANGNYDIEASWSADTKEMVFTAKGDNGQTFTATASKADLDAAQGGKNLALSFGNGNTEAFTMTIATATTYSTTNDATMETVAKEFSNALTVSASGGVDAKAAEYGLYATMTGAEDVKLSAGMDSVSFSNGVTVNFDELTTSDVTINGSVQPFATISAGDKSVGFAVTGLKDGATNADNITAEQIQNAKFEMTNVQIDANTIKADFKVNIGGKDYTASGDLKNDLVFKIGNDEKFTVTTSADDTEIAAVVAKGALDSNKATAGTQAYDYSATYNTKFGTNHDHCKSTFEVEVSDGAGLTFQIGANQGDELVINVDRMDAEYLGVASADVLSRESATDALSAVDKALNQVASQRAYLGAMQNRLDHKIANLDTSAENLTAAEGQIRDVDMAKQMTEFTNANILSQAATAMLAQANSLPQNVLSLIG